MRARTGAGAVAVVGLLLGGCTGGAGPAPTASVPGPSGSAPSVPDPAAGIAALSEQGPYVVASTSYRAADLRIPGSRAAVDIAASVTGPRDAGGDRPVVVLVHGFWASCYRGQDSSGDWPCAPGFEPIPSNEGFAYLQERLASHGYVAVSLSMNGVNAAFGDLGRDAGARARARVIHRHLDLLAAGGIPALDGWSLDLRRVLVMGHSRGGEGADRAAQTQPASGPWRIVGELLVGPTAFDPVPQTRTDVVAMSGDCDEDVGPGLGQMYVDRAAADPQLLRSSILLQGANHNWFNTEWDSATSVSGGGFDDVGAEGGDPDAACAQGAQDRLTAAEQQEMLARGLALAAAALLEDDPAAQAVLEGRAALPVLEGARTWVTPIGAGRATTTADELAATGSGVTVRACRGLSSETERQGLCGSGGVQGINVHWADVLERWPAQDAVELVWSRAGGSAVLRPADPLDLSSSRSLELRVAVEGGTEAGFEVGLTDASGGTAVLGTWGPVGSVPVGELRPARRWAQLLALPLEGVDGVDLARIAAVTLTPTTATGRAWMLDLSASPA
jgi:hypothetical protein